MIGPLHPYVGGLSIPVIRSVIIVRTMRKGKLKEVGEGHRGAL